MARKFTPKQSIIILMATGEQRYTYSGPSLRVIGKALREAISPGEVAGAVIVTCDGITQYSASEVIWLTEHPSYQ